MITLRRSEARGKSSFNWLDSRHSFSFGQYYDPAHMGVSALRVINDDKVVGGAGFDTHGHRDMEIISLVTKGAVVHKDSEGHEQILPAGEFQLMSAGTGIMHSEFNASERDDLHFLQIWVVPESKGGKPGYQQKRFDLSAPFTPVITPDGKGGTLTIKQDARISHIALVDEMALDIAIEADRHYYLHIIEGDLFVNEQSMRSGDGAAISAETALILKSTKENKVRALLFDLP